MAMVTLSGGTILLTLAMLKTVSYHLCRNCFVAVFSFCVSQRFAAKALFRFSGLPLHKLKRRSACLHAFGVGFVAAFRFWLLCAVIVW